MSLLDERYKHQEDHLRPKTEDILHLDILLKDFVDLHLEYMYLCFEHQLYTALSSTVEKPCISECFLTCASHQFRRCVASLCFHCMITLLY